MRRLQLKSIFVFTFFFVCQITHSFCQELIKDGDFENGTASWEYWENEALGFRGNFSVVNDPSLKSKVGKIEVNEVGEGYWTFKFFNIRIKQSGFSVSENDLLKLKFKAKAKGVADPIIRIGIVPEKQENNNCKKIDPCFWEVNMQDYELVNFDVKSDWKNYEAEIPVYETTDDIQLVIRVGGKVGTYFMDDISLQKSGKLNVASEWFENCQARIDTLRKGDFSLKIINASGKPINNLELDIQHYRHDFKWGMAVSRGTWQSDFQKEMLLDLFDGIVHEDDFKWNFVEREKKSMTYDFIDEATDWALENKLYVRGHTLFWPKGDQRLQPHWTVQLSKKKLKQAMAKRIERDMQHFKGRMQEYDVVNEPMHNPYLHKTLGDSIYRWIYMQAQKADPEAELYINEWGAIDLWEHHRYKEFVSKLLAQGTPLDGIGFQSHLNKPVNWKQLKYKIDFFADLGLKLKITEFDQNVGVNGESETDQAESLAIAMKTAFSHPALNGFFMWTFKTEYSPTVKSLLNNDGTKRATVGTMERLLNRTWTTQLQTVTNSQGEINFNGYCGEYQIHYSEGGKKRTLYVHFDKEEPIQEIRME